MKERILSKEASQVVDAAILIAKNHHSSEIDSTHLFYSILKNTQTGEAWVKQNGLESSDLEQMLLERFARNEQSKTQHPEPSRLYLRVLLKAQELASANEQLEISSVTLLSAILLVDRDLQFWLEERTSKPLTKPVIEKNEYLTQFGRDLTALAREGKLKQAFEREQEIHNLLQVLMQHGKNNAILMGPAGVGKTAIVEQFAQEITQQNVPQRLQNVQLFELDTTSLLANSSYRGEFESRMIQLLDHIKQIPNLILVIDEFHTIMGTGRTDRGTIDAANILKPALARGEITIIGITTEDEYRRFLESDQAFARRFQNIRIDEMSVGATLKILRLIAPSYESHHKVKILPESIEQIVKWSDHYIQNRYFPDKAIDVLARAFAKAEVERKNTVTSEMIADVISAITGVPLLETKMDTSSKIKDIRSILEKNIVGQNEAIEQVSELVQLSYTGLRDPDKPKGVFLFIGPSGVGKTELAKQLAAILFGSENKIIRLDMSEYSEKIDVSKLIGTSPGYIGYEQSGFLSKSIRNQPYSVVLLDEVEKAHPEVYDLFLQIFDEGRLRDAHGRFIDCRHVFFIMTSNIGVHDVGKSHMGFINNDQDRKKQQSVDLRQYFRPEFLNRIDRVIAFRSLDLDDLIEIAALEMGYFQDRLKEQSIRLTYERNLLELIALEAQEIDKGARGIQYVIERKIGTTLSNYLIHSSETTHWIHLVVNQGQILLENY